MEPSSIANSARGVVILNEPQDGRCSAAIPSAEFPGHVLRISIDNLSPGNISSIINQQLAHLYGVITIDAGGISIKPLDSAQGFSLLDIATDPAIATTISPRFKFVGLSGLAINTAPMEYIVHIRIGVPGTKVLRYVSITIVAATLLTPDE